MKLTLIRHTKVLVPVGICYGQTDVSLTDSYEEEKAAIRAQLETNRFDQVFSSPLSRCKRLAEDLFSSRSVLLDDRLKELDFGEWEGQHWDAIYQTSEGKHWMDHYLVEPCLGGESYPGFRSRINSFLDELKKNASENVAAFTHNGVIRLVKSILEDQPVKDVFLTFNPVYGGIYEFEIE